MSLRKPASGGAAPSDPVGEDLLDTDEQEALIAELRKRGEAQSRSTRRLVQGMSGLVILAMLYCIMMAIFSPYVLQHQAQFRSSVSPAGFILTYILVICSALVAVVILRGRKDRTIVALGFAAGISNVLFWTGAFLEETPAPSIGYWWLPLSALFVFFAAIYIDSDVKSLLGDIDKLEKLKYQYKKL